MTHRFPIKEIARQSGLGVATIDRVLNNRSHVSPQTRNRVQAALLELENQEHQLAARGRRMFVDFVVEAPKRFSSQIQSACEATLPEIGDAVYRPRFIFQEVMPETMLNEVLARIEKRGSHGVCLKARDLPRVRKMVDRLEDLGIPVVTLVTDIPTSNRTAYVGMDNTNAGRSAAYLLANMLGQEHGTILTTRSHDAFYGEAERHVAFCETFSTLRAGFRIIDVAGGAGLAHNTAERLSGALHEMEKVAAVYSMGGGNRATIEYLRAEQHVPQFFIAHDLDKENKSLLLDGSINFVLHHSLEADMRNIFHAFSAFHGLSRTLSQKLLSDVQIVTPHNLPTVNHSNFATKNQTI